MRQLFWSRPDLVQKYSNHGVASSCSDDDTIYGGDGSDKVEEASEESSDDTDEWTPSNEESRADTSAPPSRSNR